MLKGIFSETFNSVNSPANGVVTFFSAKVLFKQDVILIFVLSKMVESIFVSNKPFSSAVAVKLLLLYSIFMFEYGIVCPEIASVVSVIG